MAKVSLCCVDLLDQPNSYKNISALKSFLIITRCRDGPFFGFLESFNYLCLLLFKLNPAKVWVYRMALSIRNGGIMKKMNSTATAQNNKLEQIRLTQLRVCFAELQQQAYMFAVLSEKGSRIVALVCLSLYNEQHNTFCKSSAHKATIISTERLANRVGRDKCTIQRRLQELEEKNFIIREHRFADRRQLGAVASQRGLI